jgi:hypothetical protein
LVIALGIAVLIATVTAGAAVMGTLRSSGNEVVLASTDAPDSSQATDFSSKSQNLVTVAGVVTDDHCGARHSRASEMSAAQCAQMCVRNGSSYLLVNGEQRYALEGDAAELGKLAGQRATVSGSMRGNTLEVNSVSAPQ